MEDLKTIGTPFAKNYCSLDNFYEFLSKCMFDRYNVVVLPNSIQQICAAQ